MPRRKVTKDSTSGKPPVKKSKKCNTDNNEVKVKQENEAGSSKTDEVETKVVTFMGNIPIDEKCTEISHSQFHVHTKGGVVYNAMLNQTNIGKNNNKYYILQVLKHIKTNVFYTWFRWGRVGKTAGTSFESSDGDTAVSNFQKKFANKTGNSWFARDCFVKRAGKYDYVHIDYGKEQFEEEDKIVQEKQIKVESKLDPRVAKVIELIFDVSMWESTVKEMKFDIKKSPLGKLTAKQISSGYDSLKKIEAVIQKTKMKNNELSDACSEFYTKIPHDFGMKRPPLIENTKDLKEKLALLETLDDIQIAVSLMDKPGKHGDINMLDYYYNSLEREIVPVEAKSPEYKMVATYVKNTHADTHNFYKLKIDDVFQISCVNEVNSFKKDIKNRMLLWHGSRLTNWCGILKQGLRIAPPEAPVTGYMFGKGVYFADIVSKSANYCYTHVNQPTGFLLLCEVAVGNMNELCNANYSANKLPKGKHSTKGCGRNAPDPKKTIIMEDGTSVPLGKPKPLKKDGAFLMYNEYIVYNTSQIKPRFLVKLHFDYNYS